MKRILFVTSGQPSANPRLLKEAKLFAQQGHIVTVVYCPISNWADKFDSVLILRSKNIKWIRVGNSELDNYISFLYFRLRKKSWTVLYRFLGDVFDSAIKSSVLFSQELRKEALKHKADFYIGHNLGSIRAVVDASDKYNGKRYFDFEDFHRGESQKDSFYWKRVELIENKYVPKLSGAWAASPLITGEYRKLYPYLKLETINNCFTKEYAPEKLQHLDEPQLKLFWFSQTIGKNRGLEQIIQSIGKLQNKNIKLTLLGHYNYDIKSYLESIAQIHGMYNNQVCFLNPVSEKQIVQIAANHHIGIASEEPSVLNRELCLTNKIYMYLLAGNAILFSNSTSQQNFASENHNVGLVYRNGDIDNSISQIKEFFENRKLLNTYRLNSFRLSSILNWERESEKLISFLSV